MKLIDKDALVAWAKETYLCKNASMIRKVCYKQLLEHLDTLEVKEIDLEKEPVSKDTKESVLYNDMKPWEVPEYIIEAINKKRVCPTLKGEPLHKFKNEFNTLKQTLHLLYNLDTSVNYRLALHWASWGAQNLQGRFGISEEEKAKMDTEEPVSEDLEEAVHEYMQHIPESEPELMDSFYTWEQMEAAFKAGAKWQLRKTRYEKDENNKK